MILNFAVCRRISLTLGESQYSMIQYEISAYYIYIYNAEKNLSSLLKN